MVLYSHQKLLRAYNSKTLQCLQGENVAVTSKLPGVGVAHIVDSLFMHGSWLHVVDRPLHPPALSDEQRHAIRGAQGKLQDSSISFSNLH